MSMRYLVRDHGFDSDYKDAGRTRLLVVRDREAILRTYSASDVPGGGAVGRVLTFGLVPAVPVAFFRRCLCCPRALG